MVSLSIFTFFVTFVCFVVIFCFKQERVAIIHNKAIASGGGMVCSESSHPNLENATISGNEVESGGGIAFYGSCASLLNTILWNNSSDEIYFHELEYPRSCVEISFTDVMDSTRRIIHNNNGDVYWLEGNLNSHPSFCNSDSGIYSPAENSPCIAAGKNGFNTGALCIGCGTMDIEHERVCPLSDKSSTRTIPIHSIRPRQ